MRLRVLSAVVAVLLPSAVIRAEEVLTLDRAVEMARNRHPSVDAQRAQVTIAEGRAQQSVASLLPFLTGGFAYQPQTANYSPTPANVRAGARGRVTVLDANSQPVTASCTAPGVDSCMTAPAILASNALVGWWNASVGIGWTPWDWGKSLFGYESARSAAASAAVGVVTVQRNVVLNVKLAFFAVIAAGEQVTVGLESVTAYRKQLDQIRAFYDQGLRTGIDVATAESALAAAEVTLTRARAGLETARAQLSLALGEDSWHGWRLVLDVSVFDQLPGDEARAHTPESTLATLAFGQRSELHQLDLLGLSYRQLERSQRAGYLPRLDLDAGSTWTGLGLSSLVRNVTISVALEFPLGGMSPLLVHGQVREAHGNLLATLAQERATSESIRQETVDARALLASALEEIVAAHKLVTAATAQRDLAIGRYATGVGAIIELTNAMLNYVSARFQLVQAGYDIASARAQLQHALGEEG
jgi:outer membrane protein